MNADRDRSPSSPRQAALPKIDVVARRAGISTSTLRRWVKAGAIPQYEDAWTPAAVAHVRIVSELRKAGFSLDAIAEAARDGRLALGQVDELFRREHVRGGHSLKEAAKRSGLEPALIERIWIGAGFTTDSLDHITDDDIVLLDHIANVLASGFPLVALLQLLRVWVQAISQVAEAESRLFRIYVHEPMLRQGVSGGRVADAMGEIVSNLLPHAKPVMEYLHDRYLQHFVEQHQIENLQATPDAGAPGRMRVAIAFVDMAGFTRYTEEVGELEAFQQVERLHRSIEDSLPATARIVKTTGDGVMVIGPDEVELVDWAIGLVSGVRHAPLLRAGVHIGPALYREGDYYGGAVNLAARLMTRAAGGEVVVSEDVAAASRVARADELRFESLGRVRLKGFSDVTQLFRAERAEP